MPCDSVCGCCNPCKPCGPKKPKLCSGSRSGRTLKKHKAYTPPKHSCFDPEELPGGSKFASLKGLPPPPCYSCGQNAKPRPKPERSGSPAARARRHADKATGPGHSQGPAASGSRRGSGKKRRTNSSGPGSARSSTASAKRSSERRGSSRRSTDRRGSERHGSERHGSERHGSDRRGSRSSKSPSARASGAALPQFAMDETGQLVERTPSGRVVPVSESRRASGMKKLALQEAARTASREGSPGLLKSGSAAEGSRVGSDELGLRSSMVKRTGPEGTVMVTKSGTTFAVDEFGRVVPSTPAGRFGAAGDFLQMMSFVVGLAAGYGLSSMFCRLTRCRVLTILRNMRDLGAFLCSERCNTP